jgi:hypothetical protein
MQQAGHVRGDEAAVAGMPVRANHRHDAATAADAAQSPTRATT